MTPPPLLFPILSSNFLVRVLLFHDMNHMIIINSQITFLMMLIPLQKSLGWIGPSRDLTFSTRFLLAMLGWLWVLTGL